MEIYIPKVAFFATVPGYIGLINLYKFPLDNFHLQDLLNRTLGTFKSGIDDFVGTLCHIMDTCNPLRLRNEFI
jgi:hypothetical protein